MIDNKTLERYLHDYLNCGEFNDYAPNGLQIEGKKDIHLICTAVTASQSVIDKAVEMQADALMVHHGYFWRGENSVITGIKRKRIGQIIHENMNLYAYHLPLDCHLDIGNNACIGALLEIQSIQPHSIASLKNIIWTGQLNTAVSPETLKGLLSDKLKREPLWINGGHQTIRTIAWCTGAAQDYIIDAKSLGVDAYISGEVSERTYYQATELGIHYYACGHHATERFGIQALGQYLSANFELKHQFLDSDNPV